MSEAYFFDINFWKYVVASAAGSGVVATILGICLKYLFDSRMERQKKELAEELYETQIKTRIRIDAQIEGIDRLLQATLAYRDASSELVRTKEEAIELGLEEIEREFGRKDGINTMKSESEIRDWLMKKFEHLQKDYVPVLIDFVDAYSFACARMEQEQRNHIDSLRVKIFREQLKGNPAKVISELRRYLEAESRRLRDIEKEKKYLGKKPGANSCGI